MNRLLITICLVVLHFSSFAQTTGEMTMKSSFWSGTTLEQNGQTYKVREALDVMKGNQEAYDLMKSAKSSYDMANVFAFAGGALIGWPLGSAIAGGDPNWALAGIGAGLIVISIPIANTFKKKADTALEAYNSSLDKNVSANQYQPKLEFASGKNGLGLRLTF